MAGTLGPPEPQEMGRSRRREWAAAEAHARGLPEAYAQDIGGCFLVRCLPCGGRPVCLSCTVACGSAACMGFCVPLFFAGGVFTNLKGDTKVVRGAAPDGRRVECFMPPHHCCTCTRVAPCV